MSNEIATVRDTAAAMYKSGYFPDLKNAEQAMVKVMAGREFGVGPWASLTQIHIVQGKPTLGANLLASLVKRHPHYNYRVIRSDNEACELEFREDGEPMGPTITYTIKDADQAGLTSKDTWKRHPSDLLFARAMTRGVRRYCPDVTEGVAAYTPDEIQHDPPAPVAVEAEIVFDGRAEYKALVLEAQGLGVAEPAKEVATLWAQCAQALELDPTISGLTQEQFTTIAKMVISRIQESGNE